MFPVLVKLWKDSRKGEKKVKKQYVERHVKTVK